MKVVHIKTNEMVEKTKKELEIETKEKGFPTFEYKTVKLKEPVYIVELSMKELQLISFYLELENRKHIVNVEIDTNIKGDKND